MPTCPECHAELHAKLARDYQDHEVYRLNLEGKANSKINILLETLHLYWRWMAEGQKPYFSAYSSNKDDKKQYYYDTYHNSMHYHQETDTYSFSIQTSDSPEGDTWWRGSFQYNNGRGIINITGKTEHT